MIATFAFKSRTKFSVQFVWDLSRTFRDLNAVTVHSAVKNRKMFENKGVAVRASNAGRQLDRAGKTLEVLSGPDRRHFFGLSPDGKRLVALRAGTGGPPPPTELWLMDVERRVFSLFAPTSRVGAYLSAVWSNDGRTVLFHKRHIVLRKDITASGEGERIAEWAVVALHWKRRFWDCPSIYCTGIVEA